jgi:hypothetical protein
VLEAGRKPEAVIEHQAGYEGSRPPALLPENPGQPGAAPSVRSTCSSDSAR